MKIRTKISFMILFVTVLLSCLVITVRLVFNLFHHQKYLSVIQGITNDFVEWNNEYSSKSLGSFLEYHTELQAKKMLEIVETAYIDAGKDSNALAGRKDIRSLFMDSVRTKSIKGGYAALVYDREKVLICSKIEDEGMGIDSLLKNCSQELKDKIYSLTPKDSFNCYFTYTDNTKKVYNEFASVYFIPDSKLMFFYCLPIGDFLKPLLLEMAKNRQTEKEKVDRDFYLAFSAERKYEIIFGMLSFIVVYLLSIPLIIRFSKSVSSPISELRNEVQKIGKGRFNVSIRESGVDEVRDLINSFNYLGKELSVYMENLKHEVKERQKIETEINIARGIQESILPKITSAFASGEFQLGAKLLPAEKVAGDFYDFFFANGKLILCIADISGKGIYAAFFMAMTKILIKNLCLQYSSPEKVLFEANRTLAEGNQMNMFATVFLCFFDLETGVLKFSNAGHEDVLLIRNDKFVNKIGRQEKPPVGLFADSEYIVETIKITDDDMLVFYTDGITEARSSGGKFFGVNNLKEVLMENKTFSPQDLCNLLIAKTSSFEGGKLFDDMTVMIFKKLGKGIS